MVVSTLSTTPDLARRELGRIEGKAGGPTLICVAGLHGNEPAGVEAVRRVFARLERSHGQLAGRFIGLLGNRRAFAAAMRFLETDLNRIWTHEQIARIEDPAASLAPDEIEQRELLASLREIFATAPGEVYVLDLHSTSGPGPAFAVLDDTLANRRFAMHLPVPVVLGIEEELDGTLATFVMERGAIAAGFECGQHQDPASVDRGEAAVWIALAASGVIANGSRPEVRAGIRYLAEECCGLPRVVETRYRHPIEPGDGFKPEPGLVSFTPVRAGQVLSWTHGRPDAAPESGLILMPLYQEQGEDGFFIVRKIHGFWLGVSTTLRRLGAERVLHWLPGVRRLPERDDAFVVDRGVARWYTREIFHLLGFRRHGGNEQVLEFSRRTHHPRRPAGRRKRT